jgi:hypothetical protein
VPAPAASFARLKEDRVLALLRFSQRAELEPAAGALLRMYQDL